jgi:hypothetical protein
VASRRDRQPCLHRISGSESDDGNVPGQERLPKDQSTSDSSNDGEDAEDEEDEESDGDRGNDNIDAEAMNLGDDVGDAAPDRSRGPTGKGRYNSWLRKGVWKPSEDDPEDNLEVNFLDFTELPDSPKPDYDDPLVVLGPRKRVNLPNHE